MHGAPVWYMFFSYRARHTTRTHAVGILRRRGFHSCSAFDPLLAERFWAGGECGGECPILIGWGLNCLIVHRFLQICRGNNTRVFFYACMIWRVLW